jgi:hypothetical protein
MGGGIEMKKVALFAFNGDPMCFIHVLLNALDMHAKGQKTKIVMEGAATQWIPELGKTGHHRILSMVSARPVPTKWEPLPQQKIRNSNCWMK